MKTAEIPHTSTSCHDCLEMGLSSLYSIVFYILPNSFAWVLWSITAFVLYYFQLTFYDCFKQKKILQMNSFSYLYFNIKIIH